MLEEACRLASMLAGEGAAIAAGVLLFALWGERRSALRLLAALLVASATVVMLKGLIASPRPPSELWRAPAEGYGFPSGHVAATTTLLLALSVEAGLPLVIVIVAVSCVALSRIILGVHYPVDVVGGAIVGVASYALARLLLPEPTPRRLAVISAYTAVAGSIGLALDSAYRAASVITGIGLGALASFSASIVFKRIWEGLASRHGRLTAASLPPAGLVAAGLFEDPAVAVALSALGTGLVILLRGLLGGPG